MFELFRQLSSTALESLAALLRDSEAVAIPSRHHLQQLLGTSKGVLAADALSNLLSDGWTAQQLAVVLQELAVGRRQPVDLTEYASLVLSGPKVQGVPVRDTAAVMRSMFEQCCEEAIVVGYAFHQGQKLFSHLAARRSKVPQLKVQFIVNTPRKSGDVRSNSLLLADYLQRFKQEQWPWEPFPELYYDPRALKLAGKRASMHAKCLVIDRRVALITSANFTEQAQERNIEIGTLIEHAPTAERLADFLDALMRQNLRPLRLA